MTWRTAIERPVLAGATVLEQVPTARVDGAFGQSPEIHCASVSALDGVSLNELLVWCVRNATYQVPTLELVDWLRFFVAGRRAIEVCAGHGVIGRELGIPRTDSYMQLIPEVREMYESAGQPIVTPPRDVEALEALAAVRKYEPEVVIACWGTQLYRGPEDDQASIYGVDEEAILDSPSVQTYIHVGNIRTHGRKRILRRTHQEFVLPFLASRAFDQTQNRVWVWHRE